MGFFLISTAGLAAGCGPCGTLDIGGESGLSVFMGDQVMDGDVTAVAPGFLAVLAPYRVDGGVPEGGGDGPLDVTPVDLGEGVVAYTVATDGALDLVLLRDPGAPTSLQLSDGTTVDTDAALAVVSVQGPPVALIARGTALSVDGAIRVTGATDGTGFAEN